MILNFVLMIWEEQNLGRYEHARACRERARATRAAKQIHQPSKDIIRNSKLCVLGCVYTHSCTDTMAACVHSVCTRDKVSAAAAAYLGISSSMHT
jgi:hypothetical protein